MRCAFAWGLKRERVKALYDARAWREVALEVLRTGYADDLSYFYLGKAAEGLGYHRAAESYYRLSRAATLKCSDIYGFCYGFVAARDARPGAPPVVKKNTEAKEQVATAPKPKEPAPMPETAVPSQPAVVAEPEPPSGDAPKPPEDIYQAMPAEQVRRAPPEIKKPAPAKPVQQSGTSKARGAAKAETPPPPAPEKKTTQPESKPSPGISFEEIREKFGSRSQLTEAQKRQEWKNYQGRCVEWRGELSYVGDSFIRGLTLGFKHNPQTLTYDVLVSAPEGVRDAALRMKKGARYTYRGTLKKYGGPILPVSVDWGCGGEPRVAEHAKTE